MRKNRPLQAALEEGKKMRAQLLVARKLQAKRAWENGRMTITEIAQLVKAGVSTVRRWASEGGWSGTPSKGSSAPPCHDGAVDNLRQALRATRHHGE